MTELELKNISPASAAREKCDALIVLVEDGYLPTGDPISGLVGTALDHGDFEPKAGKMLQAYRPQGIAATRVFLCGVGDCSAKGVRQSVTAAIAAIKTHKAQRVLLLLPTKAGAAVLQAAVLAAADAAYTYSTTKGQAASGSKDARPGIAKITVGVADKTTVKAAFAQAVATAAGVELAREWGNRPANIATPSALGDAARDLAKAYAISCEVLGPKEVSKLGMGAFEAVARGSRQPLRFIVLKYQGGPKDQAPVVLVGKGITFDTGGISIKPAAEMDEMKFDMCGAASVLGTFRTLGELRPAINVVGLIPACENMPDGQAVKPGDVVTSMSGQTIEILNTDAEGRLILCDALTYAERFKPSALIDIATLTGACVVALGGLRSGLFSSSDRLADALLSAGQASGDLCWRMPLDDEYAEGLKTHFADVANVAGRAGGAITAAKFLHRFAKYAEWAHLDIAGSAWKSGAAKGATGRPVPLLVAYLLDAAMAVGTTNSRPARKKSTKPR